MRKLALMVGAQDVEEVLDRLLPLLPQGVHDVSSDETVELIVYGGGPSRVELEAAVGAALLGSSESEVGEDPARRRLESHREPIGGRVLVRPEGAPEAAEGIVDVVVEGRSGVFGAGTHPTTEMCLELLLGLEPAGPLADLGCGTGVVAIAAAKLGWAPVFALDHEASAVEATVDNARRNGVDIDAIRADLLESPPPPVTALVANVPPAVHERLAARLPPEVRVVIASGVDTERFSAVFAAYGLRSARRLERNGWAAALLVRRG